MAVDERWPVTRYGQDLNKAVPNSVQAVAGTRVFVPSLNKMPYNDLGLLNIQDVIGASATVDPNTGLVIIQRVAPTATALQLPSVHAVGGVLGILDWSTAVSSHVITLTPFPGQTIMRHSTFQIVSTGDGGVDVALASLVLVPVPAINGWMIW